LKNRYIISFFLLIIVTTASAQNDEPKWKREPSAKADLQLFHSVHVINLPTAETLQKKDMQFDVSHRFIPPVTEGGDAAFNSQLFQPVKSAP